MKLVNPDTGSAITTRTSSAGLFSFPSVQATTYTVTITRQGFSVFRILAQSVDVGSTVRIDATLQPGATTAFIDSPAAVPQSASAGSGASYGAAQMKTTALLGNEASSMSAIATSTTSTGAVAGAMSDQNRYLLDGGTNSDDMSGDASYTVTFAGVGGTQTSGMPSGVVPTSTESVEQVRLSTSGASSDATGALGGTSQMVTKRGTNQYHGVAYGSYYGSNWGGANSWVNNHTPSKFYGTPYTPLVVTHRSRFGGSLGGVVLPDMLGGKTYLFINYEGSRFPNGTVYGALDPSMLMRAGVIQVANSAGQMVPYNMNPTPVTVGGQTYQPAMCGTGLCDPRGIGMSSAIKQLWNMMPAPNEFQSIGDQYNVQGYVQPIKAPLVQNSEVIRLDHNFGSKNRFFASYRHTITQNTSSTNIAMDPTGNLHPTSQRPQHPSLMVYGLTSTLRPNLINDFRFSYLRNVWEYITPGAPPQFAGLTAAIEPGGEGSTTNPFNSASNNLSPYTTVLTNNRSRIWDGQDKFWKDDIAWIKGKHNMEFGFSYMRNNILFARNDNPNCCESWPVDAIQSANINFQGFQYPSTVPTAQQSNFNTYYSYVLGMVSQKQQNFTRDHSLALLPTGSMGYNQAITPFYTLYGADSWRVKPSVTISYGLSYMIQNPPTPYNGTPLITLVDSSTMKIVDGSAFIAARKQAMLAGQAYTPTFDAVPLQYVAGKPSTAYSPYYGGLSPRVGVAWTPHPTSGILKTLLGDKKTSIRASYGRVYGRINAIRTYSSAMQFPGIMQTVTCPGPSITGQCTGNNGVTPSTVFRIGPDGLSSPLPTVTQVLQEPYSPGLNGAAPITDSSYLDPNMRPQRSDNFTFALSRQITNKIGIDIGYTGRKITQDILPLNLDSVPYMMTVGGQQFSDAYAKTFWQIPATGAVPATLTAQPFFETALGGANSAYCQGYANCTSAVAAKNTTAFRNTAVADLWTALYKAPGWTLGRATISQPYPNGATQGDNFVTFASAGWANYNGVYSTVRLRDYYGFTGTANFTFARALGTPTTAQSATAQTVLDTLNWGHNYGVQSFDIKALFNFSVTYSPKPFASQKGVIGHVLGGWRFAPMFVAQSGSPITVQFSEGGCTGCQAYGEVSVSSSLYKSITTNAVAAQPYEVSTRATYNSAGTTAVINGVSTGVGTTNPTGVNIFKDPAAAYTSFRRCVLGYDWSCAGYAMRGLPYWNMDMGITKTVKTVKEGVGVDLRLNFTNVFNHPYMASPSSLTISTANQFGRITAANSSSVPRQMQVGLRLYF